MTRKVISNLGLSSLLCIIANIGCSNIQHDSRSSDIAIEADIPNDTIDYTHPDLEFINGKYLFFGKPYSGVVYKVLKGFPIETYSSILNGQLHGIYKSYYASGKPYEVRMYQHGLSVGTHFGYWEDSGDLRFEYNYSDQEKEGIQKTWYANGELASVYNYKNDRLHGLQQAWRRNGSLYRNFTVKNGIKYGLQRSKTCFALNDEKAVLNR